MNTADLKAMPGVLAVIRDERLLRNPAQGGAGKAPRQGPAEVFYLGQPIALIVAETMEQARDAALAARAEYDDRSAQGVFDGANADYETPPQKQSTQGDLDAAMDKAAARVDETYTTPSMSHAAMEPHAAVAWGHDGRVTVRGSYQMLHHNALELADALGVDVKKVRILGA